jgi:formylglycine-generating enzyme required for sulfatase activity
LVTGVTPPEAAIIVNDGIKSPKELNSELSEKLSSIILQSLSVRPIHRTQSIYKLKMELMGISQPKVVHEIEEFTDILTEVKTMATNTTVPKLGPIFTEVVNDIIFKMIAIESGTFLMGSNDGDADERPVRNVTLNGFYMGQTEVNQSLWKAVMSSNPSDFKGDNLPVEQVSWDDVQIFLGKLNKRTGKNYRLPTEAEWEYAAGGGEKNRTKFAGTNNESNLGLYAWYDFNSNDKTHALGIKEPNQLGLYDMSGNVWEWCSDWYDKEYHANSSQYNPKGRSSDSRHVIRGGSWYGNPASCRVAYRGRDTSDSRSNGLGFRLALVF